jgi:hypothetical protein
MLVSTFQNKSLVIGFLSIRATWNQFQGYGLGYLQSFIKIRLFKQQPEKAFPELFFKK